MVAKNNNVEMMLELVLIHDAVVRSTDSIILSLLHHNIQWLDD
jgi:hypothetical protein